MKRKRTPPIDPTRKMRIRLGNAARLVEQHPKVTAEVAWGIRKLYLQLENSYENPDPPSHDAGPIVAKRVREGYSAAMYACILRLSSMAADLLGIVHQYHRVSPYHTASIAKICELADAYDLLAQWEAAEALGNWCLAEGMLMTGGGK